MRTPVATSALYVRIPVELRTRLDAEVFRQRSDGHRWSLDLKTLVTELLSAGLAPKPAIKVKKKK